MKGNSFIAGKEDFFDYFKYFLGAAAGIGWSLIFFTDNLPAATVLLVSSFLIFYFAKENFTATPTMVINIEDKNNIDEVVDELQDLLK